MVKRGTLLPSYMDCTTFLMMSLFSMIYWILAYLLPCRCWASCTVTLELNCLLLAWDCFWKDYSLATWCAFSKSFSFEQERDLFLREKVPSLVLVAVLA